MSVADVVVATFETGRHLVFVKVEKGAPEVQVVGSVVTLDGERAVGATAARTLLERPEIRVSSLKVMFLTSVPVTSSIVVRFGPDGRVVAVEGPYGSRRLTPARWRQRARAPQARVDFETRRSL